MNAIKTMKAVVLNDFGPAENLKVQDVEVPEPGINDVLVAVRTTSVNLADVGVRSGMFAGMMKPPLVLGFDVAGVIAAVGEGVTGLEVGAEVYYAVELTDPRGGANAEFHVSSADRVARKPNTLSFEEAAAVPVAGGTAYAALITAADLRLGQSVLIHGAAGGVGSYAVQLAKAAGASVFASCGGYDAEWVSSLGADVVIDYRKDDLTEIVNRETAGAGVDVVFDAAGGNLAESVAVTKLNGQLVTVAGVRGDLNPAMRKNLRVHFVHLENAKEKLDALRVLFERGQLKSVVGASYPLERLPEAHRLLEEGGSAVHGKIVVRVT